MKYSILALLVLLFADLSCQQMHPEFTADASLELSCLDSLILPTKKTFLRSLKLESSNKYVVHVREENPYCIHSVLPGTAMVYLTDVRKGVRYDSVRVSVARPDGLAPVVDPLLQFGCSVEDVVAYETNLGFVPVVKGNSVKSPRTLYGNAARGVYYNFDKDGRLMQVMIPFIFGMLEKDAELFTRYMLSQGLPAAELGAFKVSLLYSGESEKEYQAAYDAMRAGAVDNPSLSGKTAVCYAFTQVAEPAMIYFPVEDLYSFPKYSYDLW